MEATFADEHECSKDFEDVFVMDFAITLIDHRQQGLDNLKLYLGVLGMRALANYGGEIVHNWLGYDLLRVICRILCLSSVFLACIDKIVVD